MGLLEGNPFETCANPHTCDQNEILYQPSKTSTRTKWFKRIAILTVREHLLSETGRIRFRGVRFQTPNSVSFSGLTQFAPRVPLSLLFVCQSELTEFFAELTAVKLSEFSSPKQYSRNSIPPVSYGPTQGGEGGVRGARVLKIPGKGGGGLPKERRAGLRGREGVCGEENGGGYFLFFFGAEFQ